MIKYVKKESLKTEPALIVSVESRKGGVGKTTAALCLARLLLKYGYKVLVMDLDVTGTNAADIAESPFWKDNLHVIKNIQAEGGDKKISNPINFLTLFEQCFMSGKVIPDFSTKTITAETMSVDLDMVNVLGSQIYKTKENNRVANAVTCIERPGILFDDLHTLWMVEFVKQITENFVRVSHSTSSSRLAKVAIILDNSPGYVGIAPSIHEWLTDKGPQQGKFLTVMSLDVQDLLACERAIGALHGLFESKWRTSCLFKQAGNVGQGINIGREEESFFLRLATSASSIKGEDPLAFYKQNNKSKHDGDIFCNHPNMFTAAIINRVPRAIKMGQIEYSFPLNIYDGDSSLQRLFNGSDHKLEWRERMVTYDEYIENQFLLQSFPRRRSRTNKQLYRLIESLESAERELCLDTENNLKMNINLFEEDYFDFEGMNSQLIRANDIVNRSRAAVSSAGFNHLARLIHDEWLPGSIVQDFRNSLFSFLRENDFPYYESVPFRIDTGPKGQKFQSYFKDIKMHIQMELHHLPMKFTNTTKTDVLSGSLSRLISLSLSPGWWQSFSKMENISLFSLVLAIELKHWSKINEDRSNRFSLQQFLSNETVNEDVLHDKIVMDFKDRYLLSDNRRDGWSGFADFYKVCTSAQARLIDFMADSRFLIQLIIFVLKCEKQEAVLFPYIKGIAEDVIVSKTVSHDDAPKIMQNALQTAEYFNEYEEVLKRILADWRVTNE